MVEVSPPTEGPLPLTLSESAVTLAAMVERLPVTDREKRAVEVALRMARRGRDSSTSSVNGVVHLIAARELQAEAVEVQRRATEALERAIGSATTATEFPAQR